MNRYKNQSLFESQEKRDQFLEQCHELIHSINKNSLQWDSIKGGCYQQNNNKIKLSTIHNLLLSDFFLAAGSTFLDGNLTYTGNNIIKAINELLFCEDKGLFSDNLCFSETDAPFIVDGSILLNMLHPNERQLLLALISTKQFDKNKKYWLSYNCSLIEASKKADLHLKQAQILEASIRYKLNCMIKEKYSLAQSCNRYDLNLNLKALSIISDILSYKNNDDDFSFISELKDNLKKGIATINND